ncbi:MAG: membrane protein insertase YidC [Treponema sp.]|jgi:YidC/Oxa1 family membrane protein insertase|nr:membrane protein insertase YidC [Treponema sp.]
MEKNTLLAVILSIVVMIAFYVVQGKIAPRPAPGAPVTEQPAGGTAVPAGSPEIGPAPSGPPEPGPSGEASTTAETPEEILPENQDGAAGETAAETWPVSEQYVNIETDLLRVVLSNAGGDVVSFRLKEHNDKDEYVEMVLPGEGESHAFTVAFGGIDAKPVSSFFAVRRLSTYSVEFYRDFTLPPGGGAPERRFRLTKRYNFKPGEYMFELAVALDGGYSTQSFNFNAGTAGISGAAYTLAYGPQMGPKFEKLDQRYEYRNYMTFVNGKRKMEKVGDKEPNIISSRPSWAAIAGKYFTFIAIPYLAQYDLCFSARPEPGLPSASRFYIIRPPLNSSRTEDVYRFYMGPKTQDVLNIYNNGDNGFGLRDMQLIEAASSRGFLAPLEKILKWLLLMFHRIVPNYGVAIILLTLLVKVVFFPLTKKSSEATLRMQALSPKIKELQEKYKGNPQKMNAEMAVLYKKEGYNPVSGCLPMLLQIPIFFAMYNLFNNHFDLRGALFIPRWIPDLSLPESILNFSPSKIPLLGWSDIRLLPFIYVGSQLLYGKVTQTPDQQGNAQMKMMLYVMPVVFFFILYDVPSGLLIYWIFSNLLTLVQQLVINRYLAPARRAQVLEQAGTGIPKKKKKR